MNWLSLALGLLPHIVLGIQTVVGDKASGATKQQMAKDALAVAVNGASAVTTGANAVFAGAAGQVAGLLIDQTVAITKAQGTYQKATAIAQIAVQDVQVAAVIADLVKATNAAPVTPAP